MKQFYLLIPLFSIILSANTFAQIDQPSVGAGYSNFAFYELSEGRLTTHEHNTWDIAFSTGSRDLGVFVNEAVGLSFSAPPPPVELYLTNATDFSTADTVGMERIYNNEESWLNGAFNHVLDPDDALDFGWGSYDPPTRQVKGTRIFAIKLRTGQFKKIEIQSLISGAYTFRYADLDGSNEITQTIDKADYGDKTLAYFSLEKNAAVDLEPQKWDLLFTRYTTPLDAGGAPIEYTVTGVLSNQGLVVAQADEIDPTTVNHEDYKNAYSDTLNAIGHDWKSFQGGWSIVAERVYFVKTADNDLWMIEFLDFEGSSTGGTTLERTFIGVPTSVNGLSYEHLSSFDVFPNPATDAVHLSFEINSPVKIADLQLFNALGQVVLNTTIDIQNGLNVKRLSMDQYPRGTYHARLKIGKDIISKSIIAQ